MDICTYRLEKMIDFHDLFRAFRSHDGLGYWFRGQSLSEWSLLPKAGRKEYFLPENRDLGRFKDWCRHAVSYCTLPKLDLESIALAQHHGLVTRLLDWTMNPLVAAYFCCIENQHADGSIYILETPKNLASENLDINDLQQYEGVMGYIPKLISPRMLSQRGLFTIHCDAKCEIPITESILKDGKQNLTRIIIKADLKISCLKMLDDYGINQVSLFPDLDGLSKYMNYKTLQMKK